MTDHDQAVRAFALLSGGAGFVSVANDGTAKVRRLDGSVLQTFINPVSAEGKPYFCFGVAPLALPGCFATCNEDLSVRVYGPDGLTADILHPGATAAAAMPGSSPRIPGASLAPSTPRRPAVGRRVPPGRRPRDVGQPGEPAHGPRLRLVRRPRAGDRRRNAPLALRRGHEAAAEAQASGGRCRCVRRLGCSRWPPLAAQRSSLVQGQEAAAGGPVAACPTASRSQPAPTSLATSSRGPRTASTGSSAAQTGPSWPARGVPRQVSVEGVEEGGGGGGLECPRPPPSVPPSSVASQASGRTSARSKMATKPWQGRARAAVLLGEALRPPHPAASRGTTCEGSRWRRHRGCAPCRLGWGAPVRVCEGARRQQRASPAPPPTAVLERIRRPQLGRVGVHSGALPRRGQL